jgi:hypothetical protein
MSHNSFESHWRSSGAISACFLLLSVLLACPTIRVVGVDGVGTGTGMNNTKTRSVARFDGHLGVQPSSIINHQSQIINHHNNNNNNNNNSFDQSITCRPQ